MRMMKWNGFWELYPKQLLSSLARHTQIHSQTMRNFVVEKLILDKAHGPYESLDLMIYRIKTLFEFPLFGIYNLNAVSSRLSRAQRTQFHLFYLLACNQFRKVP